MVTLQLLLRVSSGLLPTDTGRSCRGRSASEYLFAVARRNKRKVTGTIAQSFRADAAGGFELNVEAVPREIFPVLEIRHRRLARGG